MLNLSEIKGEKAIELVAELIEPIANLAEDKEFTQLFDVKNAAPDVDKTKLAMKRIKKGLPKLLKNHKKDLITILATLNDETYTDYEKRATISVLVSDAMGLLTDESLLDFLSFVNATGN